MYRYQRFTCRIPMNISIVVVAVVVVVVVVVVVSSH